MKDSKLTKLEEKKLRRDMESFLESANNIRDPQERLEEFKEIREYLEEGACPDLKEQVEQKIVEQETLIKQMLNERLEMQEELGIESTKDLKEKLTKIAEDVKLTEKEAKDWKEISEQLQEKLTEANNALDDRPTNEFVEYQKNKIAKLSEKMNEHDTKASGLVKELAGAYKSMKESNDKLNNQITELTESNKTVSKDLDDCKTKLKEATERNQMLVEKYKEVAENYKKALKEIKLFKELLEKNRNLFEKSITHTENLKESNTNKDTEINSLKESAEKDRRNLNRIQRKFAEENRGELTATQVYYESLYNTYGDEIIPYKEKITGAVTLNEAKKYFYTHVFNNLEESKQIDDMRLPESIAITPEERARAIMHESYQKGSSVDRLPKGWN